MGQRIRIRGVVQGVGFRPCVWRIAHELNIAGWVRNDGQGVLIEVWAEPSIIEQFLQQINEQCPPLARIDSVERQSLTSDPNITGFNITASDQGPLNTAIVADAATCSACLAEVNDPNNRRYRYAFTNCTHCGPRFSIIKTIPFDRANTSMAEFIMCPACQAEYDSPQDRRFHAQANACPDCGPRLSLLDKQGGLIDCDDVVEQVAKRIKSGQIVAIKGLTGFHLACDASNETAVARLRQAKRRYEKPFALLASDVAMIRRFASIDAEEQALLQSPANPIVLLRARGQSLASSVAPQQTRLGVALPATALHHLIMRAVDTPLVFTSANINDEPQCIDNDEALAKLGSMVDAFVMHNRAIIHRLDDSVARIEQSKPRSLRRARGYAPTAMRLPAGFESGQAVLAMGAELKSSFCLGLQGQAIVSQYLGDLQYAPVVADYRQQLQQYQSLYSHQPRAIAVDKHANYLSTQIGHQLAVERGIPCIEVQHHHAHMAAVMAEHGEALDSPPALGIVLDGLGMGEVGELWGGEFLLADYRQFTRLAAFDALPLLGGAQAMREPWRNTLAHLLQYFDWHDLCADYADLELIQTLQGKPVTTLQQMADRQINSPLCSSAGRLFDAVAAALGLCRQGVSYEGQAAMALEILAEPVFDKTLSGYPVEISRVDGVLRLTWPLLWQSLLADLKRGVAKEMVAARFHRGLADAIVALAINLSQDYQCTSVILAGGVFHNRILSLSVSVGLVEAGLRVLLPQNYPVNDGAISLGQLLVALNQLK